MGVNRPPGVTLAAVVSIAGSAVLILAGAVESLLAASPPPNASPELKPALFAICCIMLGLAAWGITTAIGLFRLRSWARGSILTNAALLIFFSGVMVLSTAWIAFPPAPNAPAAVMVALKFGIIAFYSALALLGGFWLFYFNRRYIRDQFETGAAATGPGARPLSVSIIAWFLLVGGSVTFGACSLLSPPVAILGLTIQGWLARYIYLMFGAIEIWLGIGLLNLKPWSWTSVIVFFIFGNVNSLLYAALPGFAERMRVSFAALPQSLRSASQQAALSGVAASLTAGALACSIPIWFLIRNRAAFTRVTPVGAPPGK